MGKSTLQQQDELERRFLSTLWARYAVIVLGFWLLISFPTFGGGKEMGVNFMVSGVLLMVLGRITLSPQRYWASWLIALVGVWLQLAPLLFWAKTPYEYLNSTLTGFLVIAFSILVPGTPGVSEQEGTEIPEGWSYNPSSWAQRLPVISCAVICWSIARFMSAYQLGYIHEMWDPVFGDNGTVKVITSALSKSFPVSDAGLGACVYSIEALLGAKGGTRRWHTMPWMVGLFGLLVVPAGVVSIMLIMAQPLIVGHWCFWCLLTAVFMLIMIALTLDEVVVTLQFLKKSVRSGNGFWKTFWGGSGAVGLPNGEKDPLSRSLKAPCCQGYRAMFRGVSVSWNLLLSALIGVWVLFEPTIYGVDDKAVAIDQMTSALVVVISVISMAEVARKLRYLNVLFGLILFVMPWLVEGMRDAETWMKMVLGIALIGLALPKGQAQEKSGQ